MNTHITSAQIARMRRDIAVEDERAGYHFLALAREERGQPWNKNLDGRPDAYERRYGIGDSRAADAARMEDFREMRRAMRHGEAF